MRRALGFKLTTQGRHLMSFIRFCEEHGAGRVTADLAVEWATQSSRGSGDEVYQARRLDTVRIFARHLQALDAATEVPPEDVLSRRQGRVSPYLYSPQEIAALMSAAGGLLPTLRAATWRTLIGLLAVTGMRQGEACRLGRDDANLAAGTLVIRDSKFGKSRLVFLHPTAAAALRAYEKARDEAFPEPEADTFFVNSRAGRWTGTTSRTRSARSPRQPAFRPRRDSAPRGCTTCATCSPSRRCWTGTATAGTCRPGSRCYPRGSATSTPSQRTGTCRPSPNSSPWQRDGSRPPAGRRTR